MDKSLVDHKIFNRIFGRDKDGKAILEELNRIYYHRSSYTSGDSALDMAFKEGQRSVVTLLNRKTNNKGGQDD